MKTIYADLHIHIGRTGSGRPVKITGSRSLTLEAILEEAAFRKGLDLIGVIDCHVPEVLDELTQLIESGRVIELSEGGLRFDEVTLILGTEIEVKEESSKGPIHLLAYMPTLKAMRTFSSWLSEHMTNITLSTQRFFNGTARDIQYKTKALGGLFVPAHVFTPFKSLYGVGVTQSLSEILDPDAIDAIELGLSSDTEMAEQLLELRQFPFLSNSDAHSLAKIAREYQTMRVKAATFSELKKVLKHEEGRAILANYGLNPRLGKYHRSRCADCQADVESELMGQPCPACGSKRLIKGVYERLVELCPGELLSGMETIAHPPYIHQVPLDFIPGIGKKTLMKLLDHFGTEMAILHEVPIEALEKVVGEEIAERIVRAREGTLTIQAGGAGHFGKIT
ncbi:endonuclease Q family protein [Pullulanibacillus sp. KACC 23026]|uniref:endonuclease Q family protein n=1 Tax=Pullulanibacillus sp. KACC 23026 TaxID=3028315 RepID=UPI0023B10639|nr:endonuclease Q family protein [Pullulanibacillus sp. KACC 23026]WEG14984.1 endonuclease Q family protein [Pullulanibacillus sp. KACC 23026]